MFRQPHTAPRFDVVQGVTLTVRQSARTSSRPLAGDPVGEASLVRVGAAQPWGASVGPEEVFVLLQPPLPVVQVRRPREAGQRFQPLPFVQTQLVPLVASSLIGQPVRQLSLLRG